MIIGRDFTVNNFIGIAWTRQGMKKITQDDKLVIEIEEPMRQRTLISTRKVAIPPRSYAVFDLECEELEGKYKIKPNPFLTQGEPNIWIDNFVMYNTSGDKKNEEEQMKTDMPHQEVTEDTEGGITKDSEDRISLEGGMAERREPKKVCVPYCIYNLSYEHHSYIPKGKVVAFAEKEEGKNEVFEVEEVTSVESYRNWVPKKKGFLLVLLKSDFICSPAEVSAHRKVKLQSKPVTKDTIQQFEELCECFPEVFSKNSEDIGRTNLITMDIDTGDHLPHMPKAIHTGFEALRMGAKRGRSTGTDGNHHKEHVTMGKPHSDSAEEVSSRQTTQEAYVYRFPKTKCITTSSS